MYRGARTGDFFGVRTSLGAGCNDSCATGGSNGLVLGGSRKCFGAVNVVSILFGEEYPLTAPVRSLFRIVAVSGVGMMIGIGDEL